MSDELKRRLVGVAVLLAVFSLIAWWVGSRDEQAQELPQADSLVRNYDVRDLDRIAAAQKEQEAVPEPAGEAAQPEVADNTADSEEKQQTPAQEPEAEKPQTQAAQEKTQSQPEPEAEVQPTRSAAAQEPAKVEAADEKKTDTSVQPATDANGQWIVQVASVTNKDNAEGLAQRLRKKDWQAFVEQGVVKGKTYYRVRVGPYAARDDADKAGQGLKKELGYDVAVMSR